MTVAPNSSAPGVVIVGAGQAGVSTALRLRQNGFERPVILLSGEDAVPYNRPPLSKKYLTGEIAREKLLLRPEDLYAEKGVDLRLGIEAAEIDRAAKQVRTADGAAIAYDKLVLATGARPRLLPDALTRGFRNVYPFRTLADADILSGEMRDGARMLVVGGGYIGLEMAAVAAKRGLKATVVEAAERVLQRVAAPETSDYFRELHRSNGVDVREGVGLAALEGAGDRVERAVLSDGATVEADVVVVGIGILANDGLAAAAGLAVDGGVVVDGHGATGDADIFAVGDCARFPYQGQMIRLESVQNATDLGDYVANRICGLAEAPYAPMPWFWSDQYDVSLKIAGLNAGYDRTVPREGDRPGRYSVWYFRDGAFIAVDAMNDTKAYIQGKRWLENGLSPNAEWIADAAMDLKETDARLRSAG